MAYGDSYDMHICFYGNRVTVENSDYEVSFDIPDGCSIAELSELIKIACRTLISMESTFLREEGYV